MLFTVEPSIKIEFRTLLSFTLFCLRRYDKYHKTEVLNLYLKKLIKMSQICFPHIWTITFSLFAPTANIST